MIVLLLGLCLVVAILLDGFESMVLPRRVTRRWRPTRLFYRTSWKIWRGLARRLPVNRYRENMLSVFGPLSLLGLLGSWVTGLILGFALIHWGWSTKLEPAKFDNTFGTYCYLSGTTFFTLGYGDLTPSETFGKFMAVVEAGLGFGFLALIIGYLPVLYQAFSAREQSIALLDARAGSPPTAGEFFKRILPGGGVDDVGRFFDEWERWCADLLDSHLSFPVLGFYRSQHDNQSWLSALAFMLDASAAVLALGQDSCKHRAGLAFAIARHACVDLSLVYWLPPMEWPQQRLTDGELTQLHALFQTPPPSERAGGARLQELRELYEPFLAGLSNYFLFKLPRFFPAASVVVDNWQTSAWTRRSPSLSELPVRDAEGHFG